MRLIHYYICLIFSINSLVLVAQGAMESQAASVLMVRDKFQQAIDFLNQNQNNAYDSLVDLYKAAASIQSKEFEQAITILNRIEGDKLPATYYWLAVAYANQVNVDSTLYYVNRYLSVQAIDAATSIRNDSAFLKVKATDAWIRYWDNASYPALHSEVDEANYFVRRNNPQQAVDYLKLREVTILKSDWFYYLANYSFKALSYADALFYINHALSIKVSDEYLLLKSQVLIQLRKFAEANSVLLSLQQNNPLYLPIYPLLAECALSMNMADKAIQQMEVYLSFRSDDSPNIKFMARCYAQGGKYKKALTILGSYIGQFPADADAQKQRGIILYKLKTYTQALYDLSMSLDINPEDAEAYYYYGLANYAVGKNDTACYAWQKAAFYGFDKAIEQIIHHCQQTAGVRY